MWNWLWGGRGDAARSDTGDTRTASGRWTIFISYSRKTKETAFQVRQELQKQGVRDIYLDLASEPLGSRWEQGLETAVRNSRIFLCLISNDWADSAICLKEYDWALETLAAEPDYKILPILLTEGTWAFLKHSPAKSIGQFNVQELSVSLQNTGIESRQARREALRTIWTRIESHLSALNISTRPPLREGRQPYLGLKALQEEDAPVFFGREPEIGDTLERLQRMRAQGSTGPKLLVILGASGSGKSSLLRAGVLARLKENDGAGFLCLPTIRPGLNALSQPQEGFTAALEAASGCALDFDLLEEDLETCVDRVVALLREAQRVQAGEARWEDVTDPLPLILPIDQGEELFPVAVTADAGGQRRTAEAERLRAILGRLLSEEDRRVNLIAITAIRSDSYNRLQTDSHLGDPVQKATQDLSPLRERAYEAVIEGPAERAGIEIEDALVRALIDDLAGQDALPLLAFVLQRLYKGLDDKTPQLTPRMTMEQYRRIGGETGEGGIAGAITEVVSETLGKTFEAEDGPRLKQIFIPHLATVSEDNGQVLRRIASLDELPHGAEDLLDQLVDKARLVTKRKDGRYEVAHEAVLRRWPLLKGWLDQAQGSLWFKRQAEQDATAWARDRSELGDTSRDDLDKARLDFDRSRMWLQGRLDDVWQALEQLGTAREAVEEPLKSFIRPEAERLLRELHSPYADHTWRAEIGERLPALGTRFEENKAVQYGDLRDGVNVLTPARIRVWLDTELPEDRRAQLEAARPLVADATDEMGGLPDLLWCPVPPGQVSIYTDDLDTSSAEQHGAQSEPQPVQQPLWITKYPITLAQYGLFTGSGRERPDHFKEDRWWAGFPQKTGHHKWFGNQPRPQPGALNKPAQYVTWYQAVAFSRWLTDRYRMLGFLTEGAELRLPFEAEWIQAATAGRSDYLYPWGHAWDSGRTSNQKANSQFVATGLYPHGDSPIGASDMSGNAYEWCLNAFDDVGDPALEHGESDEHRWRTTKGGAYFTQENRPEIGLTEHALSVHSRQEDNPNGLNRNNQGIAVAIRLVCTGLRTDHPAVRVYKP